MSHTSPPSFDAAAHAAALLDVDTTDAPPGAQLVLLIESLSPFTTLPAQFTVPRSPGYDRPEFVDHRMGALACRTRGEHLRGFHLALLVSGPEGHELTVLAPAPEDAMYEVLCEYARLWAAADYPTHLETQELLRARGTVLTDRLLAVLIAQDAVRQARSGAAQAKRRLANAEVMLRERLPEPGDLTLAALTRADDTTFLRVVRAAGHLYPEASLNGALFRFFRKAPGFDDALAHFWSRTQMRQDVVEMLWADHRFGVEENTTSAMSPVEDLVTFSRHPVESLAGRTAVRLPDAIRLVPDLNDLLHDHLQQIADTTNPATAHHLDEHAALALCSAKAGDAAAAATHLARLRPEWRFALLTGTRADDESSAALQRTFVDAVALMTANTGPSTD